MSNIIRSFIVRTGVDMSGMTVGLSKLSTDLKRAGKQITSTGQSLTKSLTIPLLAVAAASVKFASDFEDGMAKVETIADTAAKSIGTLSDEVMSVSDNTGKAADELSESLYQAISAGANTADAMDLVDVAAKSAIAGFTDTTTAVDGLTSVLNAYGLETTDANDVANKFLITQNKGKTTFAQLASSIGGVVSISATAGVSIDDLLSSLATLTMNGISTDEAVTGVKSALSNIIKPSTEAAKTAEQLGLDFSATALQSKGLAGFLADVKEKTGGNIETIASLFGNVRGLNAVLKLTSDEGLSQMNDIMGEMQTNTTALDDAYETMSGTMSNQLKIALNSLKNVGIELGQKLMPIVNDGIIPAIKGFAEWIGKLIDGFNNLSPFMQKMITLALGIAVAIGPLTTIVGKLITTVAGLIKSFQLAQMALAGGGGFMSAITAFLGPAGTVVVAIAAIAAVVGTLIIAYNNANSEIKALNEETKALIDEQVKAAETFSETVADIEAQSSAASTLTDELYDLADKENKSTAEKIRMADIVEQLNEMYEGLNLTLDENTGQLNLNEDAVKDVIAASLKQLELNAYSERLTELYEKQAEAADNLAKMEETLDAAELARAQSTMNSTYVQGLYNDIMEDGVFTSGELESVTKTLTSMYGDSIAAYLNASMAVKQNGNATIIATEAYKELSEELAESSGVVTDSALAWEDLSTAQQESLTEMGIAQEDYTAMSEEDLQEYLDELETQQEELQNLYDERVEMTQNAFEKIESTIDLSLDDMIENLESNQELVSEWTDNLATLVDKGFDEGFIQTLKDKGIDAAKTVANLVDASDDEIKRLNEVFANGSQVAIDSMLEEFGLDTTTSAGSDAISEIADGVEENTEFTDAAVQQVIAALASMTTQVTNSNFSTIGSSMIQGMINGMNSLGSKLRSTARSLANSAYYAMNDALDICSPSKKTFEVGKFFVEGLSTGIAQTAQEAISGVKALSSNIVDALGSIGEMSPIQLSDMNGYKLSGAALSTGNLSTSTTTIDSRQTRQGDTYNITASGQSPYEIVRASRKMSAALARP
ncbi:MAG: phage tail tape measure protein [Eubacteriales bacterium]|nr:phage tail tape measure protein [Eubacteriales bacterium]